MVCQTLSFFFLLTALVELEQQDYGLIALALADNLPIPSFDVADWQGQYVDLEHASVVT